MDELKIELKDGYNALKNVYFRDGKGSIFTFRWTKIPILVSSIFVVLAITFYCIAYLYPDMGWIFLTTICSLSAFIGIIFIGFRSTKYLKWKISVDKYLNGFRKYESQWLTLSEFTFELSNSDQTVIEKWENIKAVSIYKDNILLKSSIYSSYTFPEKSMKPDQFAEFKNFVTQRMNDDPSKVFQETQRGQP
jgi:hypothetical protein